MLDLKKPVQTKGGREVTVIAHVPPTIPVDNDVRIAGLLAGIDGDPPSLDTWRADGRFMPGVGECELDLVNVEAVDPVSDRSKRFQLFRFQMLQLTHIDLDEFQALGLFKAEDSERWGQYRADPWRFFLQTDDATAARIWDIVDAKAYFAKGAQRQKQHEGAATQER